MSDADPVLPDLVEYLIVSVPALGSLELIVPALRDLVERAAIRILDLIVLVKDDQGVVRALEPDEVEPLGTLRAVPSGVTLLSEPFTAGMGVGFVLVLAGSVLATRRQAAPDPKALLATER